MKKILFLIAAVYIIPTALLAQTKDSQMETRLPIRGLAIAAPSVDGVNPFLKFIEEELAPAHFNLLILRVDYNYAYETHPELRDDNPLTKSDVKRIVEVCKKYNIRIAPQINFLGHQSWAKNTNKLLSVYPEFDETPQIDTKNYSGWPNPDGLYCKSYCPLHPNIHAVIFAIMDELMDAFETDLFHAGMDEVFYIGDPKCPRCSGRDKAELFAGEVAVLRNHLAQKNGRLMIWGDRLIDGKTTGIGEWEASMNNTYRAIDLIPKDVFICDWHYERPEPTAAYFAIKGLDVATCPWRRPEVAIQQLNDMIRLRENSTPQIAQHFQGIIETVWSDADQFLKSYYDASTNNQKESDALTLKRLIEEYKKTDKL